ncbi:MAG: hypothetical protein COT37_00810 [Parcubacteria group bacterium CG08_land_8_20_14_0_20_43_9]|nr:MAG: hypothetical protein COT37_00810 [Parcubacteria group bacterium CG08_land_8_20_14_0_20_43_9]
MYFTTNVFFSLPTSETKNAIIRSWGKSGREFEGRKLFPRLPARLRRGTETRRLAGKNEEVLGVRAPGNFLPSSRFFFVLFLPAPPFGGAGDCFSQEFLIK